METSLVPMFLGYVYGDALGQFLQTHNVPPSEAPELLRSLGPLSITGNVQMSLYTMQAICEVYRWIDHPESGDLVYSVSKHLQDWADAFDGKPTSTPLSKSFYSRVPQVYDVDSLVAFTTRSRDCLRMHRSSGVLSRMVPFGLLYDVDPNTALTAAIDCAGLTHQAMDVSAAVRLWMRYQTSALSARVPELKEQRLSIGGRETISTAVSFVLASLYGATCLDDILSQTQSPTTLGLAFSIWFAGKREAPSHEQLARIFEFPLVLEELTKFMEVLSIIMYRKQPSSIPPTSAFTRLQTRREK